MADTSLSMGIPQPLEESFKIRTTAVLTTSDVACSAHTDDSNGWFRITGCAEICFFIVVTEGDSVTITLTPQFTDEDEVTNYPLTIWDQSGAGLWIPANRTIIFPDAFSSFTGYFTIPNPGASKCRLLAKAGTSGVGTDLLARVARIFHTPGQMLEVI